MKKSSAQFTQLAESARQALARAELEARQLDHSFVGTEHLLLGLLSDSSGTVAAALKTFGVEAADIRREIEKFCPCGKESSPAGSLPLTPRARRAIELGIQTSKIWLQPQANTEHLFLGLMDEGDGFAGKVLLNLGLKPEDLRREALKFRLAQVKIVERVVRPVHASNLGKRKMREELLTHLSAIYDEELQQAGDANLAMDAAARRFGDLHDLSRELQQSQTLRERIRYRGERLFGWRAPESAARYVARTTFFSLGYILLPMLAMFACEAWKDGLVPAWLFIRPLLAVLVALPLNQFIIGILYFKMRDAMWGAFGPRASNAKVRRLLADMALAVFSCGFEFVFLTTWNVDRAFAAWPAMVGLSLLIPPFFYYMAKTQGLREIGDASWACLEIEN